MLSKYLSLTDNWTDNLTNTIDGGEGNDTVNIVGFSPVFVNGGYGDDKISLAGDYAFLPSRTVQGGKGNDIIYGVGDKKETIDALKYNGFIGTYYEYAYGDGNDTIYNYHSKDTISISDNSSYTTLTSGDNVIVSVTGSGTITLYNDSSNSTKNKEINIKGGKYEEFLNISTGGGMGGDTLGASADFSISGGVFTAFENFKGNEIDLSDYSGATKVNASAVSQAVSIVGTSANNSLKGGSGADTIFGGAGNDTVSLGGGNDVYIYSSGNDLIQDYKAGQDKIKLTSGSITSASVSSSNVILKTSNGNITVKDAKGKKITVIDSNGKETSQIYPVETETLPAGISIKSSVLTASSSFTGIKIDLSSYAATKVNASALSKAVSIIGTAANNSLKGGKGSDTIFGGAGNDTVSLGGGNDIYIYSSGNDLIQDYKAGQDKIKLASGSVSSASVSGSNVIFKTSEGNITVKNGKGKKITVIDSSGNESSNIYPLSTLPAGLSIKSSILTASSSFTGNKINLSDYQATKVNASALSKAVSIVGTSANNSLKGGKGADTIFGGAGNDTILGGASADSLFGETGNDLLKGEAGNDTLSGGSGNDTLTGGAGNDVFIFSAGKDVITDYTASDKIKIESGTISKTTYSGNNVIFSIGSGSLTVKGGKGKKITIVDSAGNTSTKTYSQGVNAYTSDLFDDTNFLTDETQLSDITEKKYSVTQIQTSDTEKLAQVSSFLTFAKEK